MTLADFLDYLERAIPGLSLLSDELPAEWMHFRRECEARELAGREVFGEEWLTRDNATEGLQEAADGANYAYFDAERTRLADGDHDDALQLAVIAAHHFFEAHQALQRLRSHTPS